MDRLKANRLDNIKYSPAIMRGFDYYTGIVFEVFDTDPENNRSMMGGGRYDGLVGLFGVAPVATVGFGWGDVTLVNFLESHDLIPKLPPESHVHLVLAGVDYHQVQSILKNLRDKGINVNVDLSGRKMGDQLKAADKKGINYALIVGENELKTNVFKLKDLSGGQEESLSLSDLTKKILST
jgi:histidyl-tRNA synthetase